MQKPKWMRAEKRKRKIARANQRWEEGRLRRPALSYILRVQIGLNLMRRKYDETRRHDNPAG